MHDDVLAGSYLRLIDFVYHSTLGLRVIKKKRKSTSVRVHDDVLVGADGRHARVQVLLLLLHVSG